MNTTVEKEMKEQGRANETVKWPSSMTARTRVLPARDWTMSTAKKQIETAFKLGYAKNQELKKKLMNVICGRVDNMLKEKGMYEQKAMITSEHLKLDEDNLKNLVVGNVDKARQDAFLA